MKTLRAVSAGLVAAPLGSRRLEFRERRRHVRSALDRLPREQRQVIELAFFHGLSQTQIAAHLGAPLGTVKSRTHSAYRQLAAALSPTVEPL